VPVRDDVSQHADHYAGTTWQKLTLVRIKHNTRRASSVRSRERNERSRERRSCASNLDLDAARIHLRSGVRVSYSHSSINTRMNKASKKRTSVESDTKTPVRELSNKGILDIHFMSDDVLTCLQLRWDCERVDALRSSEKICSSPFPRGIFATFGHLEPDGTVHVLAHGGTVKPFQEVNLTKYQDSIW